MKARRFSIPLLLIAGSLALAACDVQEPAVTAPPEQSPEPTAASIAKVDPESEEALKAGLDAMTPRMVSHTDAYSKIVPRAFRLFMHPDQGKNAEVEFDTKGLTSVSLSPYIYDFSGDADCESNKEAGVVDVIWSLDGGAPNTVKVDRNYVDLLPIDLSNSSRLRIEVNEGNGVTWCDWAGIGFIDPKP